MMAVNFAKRRSLALDKEDSLPSAPRSILGKESFAEYHFWTLDKVYFIFFFSQPNFLQYVPTLCGLTCFIFAQL
jgi:hypothetical protein